MPKGKKKKLFFEAASEPDAVQSGAAKLASARLHAVFCDSETVPFYDRLSALVAVGMFAIKTRNVARIYVAQPCCDAYLLCFY